MYQGGGNWGDLYWFVQEQRMSYIKALYNTSESAKMNLSVISLPQTIRYRTNRSNQLLKDKAILRKFRPSFLSVFTRDQSSFDVANRHFSSNVSIEQSPDLAFILGPLSPIGDPEIDVLFLIRSDSEIRPSDKWRLDEIIRRFNGTGVTFKKEDWYFSEKSYSFSRSYPSISSEVRLNKAVQQMSRGRVVVTNRLHASIIADLIGRPLFWFDTQYKKLERTRQMAFSKSEYCTDENLKSYQAESLLSAAEAAIEYLLNLPSEKINIAE